MNSERRNRSWRLIAVALLSFTWIAFVARADEAPASTAEATEQAQAMEFGIFFGGMASQYDLCVSKGFLPKGDRSAEDIAASVIEKMRQTNQGADQTAYVRKGWDFMKQQLAGRSASFTQERCTGVAAEWKKMLVTMHAN
jgi:hypothetical protein